MSRKTLVRMASRIISFVMLLSTFAINRAVFTTASVQAATVTNDSGQLLFPRLANIYYNQGGPRTPEQESANAKYDLVVVNFWLGWFSANGPDAMQKCVRNMKTINPDLLVGTYTNPMEINSDYNNTATVPLYDKVEGEVGPNGVGNWWAMNAAGQHVSSYPGTWLVNITRFATPDADGLRFPQWVANWYNENFFAKVPEFDFWFMDNILYMPRVEADWNGDGVDELRNNADTRQWYREGLIDYVDAIKAIDPNAKVIGNSDGLPEDRTTGFLNDVEFKGKLEGALIEGAIGKSYSIEQWNNWENMMKGYRDLMANTKDPHMVLFNGSWPAGSSYSLFRYEFGSCLLDNGYITIDNGGYNSTPWFDEYDLAGTASTKWLGAAIDPPQTEPWQNGVYRRDFENGMVLVNPKNTGNVAKTVTIPAGYKRFQGVQDPVTNNGEKVTTITLNARDAIILVKDNSVDKTQLLNAIALSLSLNESDFTAEDWNDLQIALTAAQIVAGNDNATQDEINNAYIVLQTALDGRMAHLKLAIEEAENYYIGDYTAASWLAFLPALAAAKSVATNVNSPQADVIVALADLLAAMDALVKPPKFSDIDIVIDGDTSDWGNVNPLAEGGQEVTCLKVTNDGTFLYFCIEGPNMAKDPSSDSPYLELMLDTDCSDGTGYYLNVWPGSGIDYLVEANENNLYKHTGVGNNFTWNNQGDSYTVTYTSDTVIEMKILKAALGVADSDIKVGVSLYNANWSRLTNGYLPISEQPMALYRQIIMSDKSALASTIEETKAMIANKGSIYTRDSVEYLLQVIANAEELLANPYATQVDVDKAIAALQTAIDALVEVMLVNVTPEASVRKLTGSQNDLTITVTEVYSDETVNIIEVIFKISNNTAGIYNVGDYKVYVDTKGNDQIRDCHIVTQN